MDDRNSMTPKPFDPNLPVVAILECVGCPTKLYVRAKPESAILLALASGWVIVDRKRGAVMCPIHNPSRIEFYEARQPKPLPREDHAIAI